MTVSATAVTEYTVDEMVAMAMITAGVLHPAHIHNPPAAELEVGRRWLYMRLQSMPNTTVVLRARERVVAACTTAVAYVDAAADTLTIEKNIILRDSTNLDRPLLLVNEADYQAIADKALPGLPTLAYPEQQPGGTWRIYLWPVPDGSEAVSVVYPRTRRLRDVEPGSVTLDLNPKWHQMVMLDLAKRFAAAKGRTDTAGSLSGEAGEERTIAENDETERGDARFVIDSLDWL